MTDNNEAYDGLSVFTYNRATLSRKNWLKQIAIERRKISHKEFHRATRKQRTWNFSSPLCFLLMAIRPRELYFWPWLNIYTTLTVIWPRSPVHTAVCITWKVFALGPVQTLNFSCTELNSYILRSTQMITVRRLIQSDSIHFTMYMVYNLPVKI